MQTSVCDQRENVHSFFFQSESSSSHLDYTLSLKLVSTGDAFHSTGSIKLASHLIYTKM